ncbi:hypothetical protein J14TS5_15980 [Paenibacillus lautus]|nr:hypothetical protein [Paenibacillus lautus]GIO96512.1 hypothetical protein J14TS5_15980 [Paenibacillus lautus]
MIKLASSILEMIRMMIIMTTRIVMTLGLMLILTPAFITWLTA